MTSPNPPEGDRKILIRSAIMFALVVVGLVLFFMFGHDVVPLLHLRPTLHP